MKARNRPNLNAVTTIAADGSRPFIHPADVRGRFTRARFWFGLLLMGVYAALPWIPVNGNPAVFLDLENRQFHFIGLTFLPQDMWVAIFLVTGMAFTLFYLTALAGRVWCGWACPQTVFLDWARRFERFFEGESSRRKRLDRQPWTGRKLLRRGASQAAYGLFAVILAHVLLSYFVSLSRLYEMMRTAPAQHWPAFLFVFGITAALFFNFAWFREQFCIVLCPYGRLQSALIDSDSIVIGYDSNRGEPRGKKGATTGDCVDCLRCVKVCPTGIDIRQGVQLECINCAACIDACDMVMEKIGRPRGLIRYDSMNGLIGKTRRILRPRLILYTGFLLLGAAAAVTGLSRLKAVSVAVTRIQGAPYIIMGSEVRNQFLLRIENKRNRPQHFTVELKTDASGFHWSGMEGGIEVAPFGSEIRTLVLLMPKAAMHGSQPVEVTVLASETGDRVDQTVPFIGPGY